MSVKNKHGLSRYVPVEVERQIRKESGYGCVICGCFITQYEHIDPEFHDAKKHEADKMTLLCNSCHGKVTNGIFSKEKVWKAKSNPKAKQLGFVRDALDPKTGAMEIIIGKNSSSSIDCVLSINGKPIIWFTEPEEVDAPYGINIIFHDDNSEVIGFIKKSIFYGVVAENDINNVSHKIIISKDNNVFLELEAKGGEPLKITRMHMSFAGGRADVCPDGTTLLNGVMFDVEVIGVDSHSRDSAVFMLGDCIEASINSIGGANLSKVNIAMQLHFTKAKPLIDFMGNVKGWIYLNKAIVAKSYHATAKIKKEGNVFTAFDFLEHRIGELSQTKINNEDYAWVITTSRDEYDTGEPIWINNRDRCSVNVRNFIGYDLSYRVSKLS
ncbi:TPA: HNH endonuclease signature motif containing protein [Klebsiella variicola]|uniref:HNH endonuclease signature motif containing protein n=1 Tax=Klebsiella pneumoniae complex TaxID=3390273 RepID=UPI0027FC1B44|nr:HNH endonuclease signature motif containing protein [Klebsiella quasipneumoniae subsp. similipneumoniae]